jgi:hypothetical protein
MTQQDEQKLTKFVVLIFFARVSRRRALTNSVPCWYPNLRTVVYVRLVVRCYPVYEYIPKSVYRVCVCFACDEALPQNSQKKGCSRAGKRVVYFDQRLFLLL